MEPALEISMVRENLALAIAYWTGVKKGLITTDHLPTGRAVVTSEAGRVVELFNPLELRGDQELARCATNQVRAAFAFSVLQTHRSLDAVFDGPPLQETDQDLRAARCSMYLFNNSLKQGMLTPEWVCPLGYRRRFEVSSISFVLDASELDNRQVLWDDFGGLEKYLELLDYFANRVSHLPARSVPLKIEQTEEAATPRLRFVEALSPSDPVSQFIGARCLVGADVRNIAGGLYAGYLQWCQETGQQSLGQRSFGIQLTKLGFSRRRRGRGRHWWEGIALAGETGSPA